MPVLVTGAKCYLMMERLWDRSCHVAEECSFPQWCHLMRASIYNSAQCSVLNALRPNHLMITDRTIFHAVMI
eukprot:1148207-Pelagomonas_calceolata.AAC.1